MLPLYTGRVSRAITRWRRPLAAAFAVGPVAVACGLGDLDGLSGGGKSGPETSVGPDGDGISEAGAPADAASDANDAVDAAPFCTTQTPAAPFCIDFDEGDLTIVYK